MKPSEKLLYLTAIAILLLLYVRELSTKGVVAPCVCSCPVTRCANVEKDDENAAAAVAVPCKKSEADAGGGASAGGGGGSFDGTCVRNRPVAPQECTDGYQVSALLSRFIDIDFIEFVMTSQPSPKTAPVVDIGIYQAGELVHMAQQGYNIRAFEPNPYRYNACIAEIRNQPQAVQERINLRNLAVSDSTEPLHFQLAGLDSHAYILKEGEEAKEKSIIVNTIPISNIIDGDQYFVKIDTQGFDTRILEQLLDTIEAKQYDVTFIQFEFSPHFEVTRAKRTKEEHKKIFRRLVDLGYDVFQGAAVQPWKKSHRSQYGKTPLAMLAVDRHMPTCVDEFVEHMHAGKKTPISPGKTSLDIGTWMDVLAVKRGRMSPYYRHTGWVLTKRM